MIPSGMEGDITVGGIKVPLKWLIEFAHLKNRGNYYIFSLPKKGFCVLKTGDITLTLGYKEIVFLKKKTAKLDRSLKRPWINKEDYSFYLTLILLAVVHFSSVNYLSAIEIKKKEPLEIIKTIESRFAKLILRPQKKMLVFKNVPKPKLSEKKDIKEEKEPPPVKSEEVPQPLTEVASLPSEPEEVSLPVIEEDPLPPEVEEVPEPVVVEPPVFVEPQEPPPPPSAIVKKELLRAKVMSKGLLGVIMAKARPEDNIDVNVFRALDKLEEKTEVTVSDGKEENVLANLNIKGFKIVKEISKKIQRTQPKLRRPRNTGAIIREKKEVSLQEKKEAEEDAMRGSSINQERNELEVHKTILKYIGGLKYLYNNALKNNPYLKGNITVKITISPEGKVKKVEKVSSTLGFPKLEKKIIKRIYRWKFMVLKNSTDFTIDYTFDFSPVS